MALSERTKAVMRNWLHERQAADELAAAVDAPGLPAGGLTNQVLAKASNADGDAEWVTSGAVPPVDSVNGQTGVVVLTAADIGGGNFNALTYFDGTGFLANVPGISIDGNSGGFNLSKNYQPNNAGGFSVHPLYVGFDPLQNSPNDGYNVYNTTVEFDINDSGFNQGSNGNAVNIFANSFTHNGTGDVGNLSFTSNSFEVGNGTDPISVRGMSYAFGFGTFHDAVTLVGPLQGYGFQPNATSGVTFDTGAYTNAFYDYANISASVPGWTSFSAGPNLAGIQNNTNYNGFFLNPTITTFSGNAGFTGIGIFGNYGTFGTGGWTGIQINPTVTSVVNATGLSINMGSVTASGTKRAMDITGDVAINGALSFTGALSIGQLQAFYSSAPVDGGGNPQNLHGLTTAMVGAASTTVANCDAIGVNTAMLITLNANSVNTSGPFGLGFAALALPCVVETHTGSSLDFMAGAVYAANLVGTSTGGTIDTINLCRSLVIPNGITTVNKARGYYYHEPFGAAATVSHAFYGEDAPGYFEVGVLVGGTPLSDDTIAASVGLEVRSTTKAFLPSRMDSTQRDALTAVNGMVIYNSTTDKLQVRAAGAWVDLH